MKHKVKYIIVILFLFHGLAEAQERLIEKGNEKFEAYSFRPAIDIYKKVLEKGYSSADLLRKLGDSYYYNAEYKDAGDTYMKLMSEFPDETTAEDYFKYAQTLKTLGDYDTSGMIMSKFKEMTKSDVRATAFSNDRNFKKEIEDNSGRYILGPFEFNSPYSEFAPSFYKEGLIFSSDRDTGNFARYRHTWNAKDFLDLYEVNADSSSINKAKKLDENVNTRYHESTSVVTKDGKTLYFTRNNSEKKKTIKDDKGIVRLKIFRAKLNEEGAWDEIEELPFNSDSYSVANPALSADEKTLYFVSDMPGTVGESDLFFVTINQDNTFGSPQNLGPNINTEARETFPYITSEEILYFSSDGHPGLGGLDVFATKIKRQDFTGKVLNVGKPVNSNSDDFTFIFNEELRTGYVASNREEGLGYDDIYSLTETRPLVFDCIQQVTGTVRDKITNEVLVGATIKVIDENNEELLSTITDSDGTYSLELDCNKGNFVRALMEGYIPFEEYLGVSDGKPKIIDFYLERDQITAGFGDDLAKLLQLSTIYFDFDKYNIRKDSEVEIEKVIAAMEKYPSLKLKVNSHTDSRGPAAYNLWLSQKRAESTVNYMIKKGISSDRLVSEGFGETKLLNECTDGVKCSAVKHDINRRSEFIILE
ncbi:OmpA family protein [Maribacter hydrothermalis]|uniref:Flagellar motor protein MotB n=1 Tax=Maribacter hydrothermalis TaxID=1836467 RepID=A0A1B7Z5Y7_9FLAO|nr:OmpA family protein [Maribacter hydrothermalis]APQ19230.1 flagellar motor protein MotB [Maribacter hydrothermalis]OBR38121.1 flagellar motor protein MotB [Maribacter hydrothermalis]